MAAALLKAGHAVDGYALASIPGGYGPTYQGDVTDYSRFRQVLTRSNPDLIIHLAARVVVAHAQAGPAEALGTNIMGTVNVLDACQAGGIPCIVASTDKAYGDGLNMSEGTPLRPRYIYDTSKACADLMAQAYARTYGMSVAITRSCNAYGPGDGYAPRLIPNIIKAILTGTQPTLYAESMHVCREYIHVTDLAAAYALLADRLLKGDGGCYNVGTGETATPLDIVRWVSDYVGGKERTPKVLARGYAELGNQSLDSNSIRALGWLPKYDLGRGLKELVEWYRTQT